VHGCPEVYDAGEGSKCERHRREADRARGTATERGYSSAGHQGFRERVLTRDPICVLCGLQLSTVADHYPKSRKELQALHLNPNDPQYGRGLCKPCHDSSTAAAQPGGWNRPQGG
jgi:5-methylcytosine-specific restriction protein A